VKLTSFYISVFAIGLSHGNKRNGREKILYYTNCIELIENNKRRFSNDGNELLYIMVNPKH
jgi:hypothetical protein